MMRQVLWTLLVFGIVVVLFVFVTHSFAQAPYNTNPPDIQEWYRHLTNRLGGECCGDADGYPAIITKMPRAKDEQGRPSYKLDGEAVIIDPSKKDIYVDGKIIKTRPELHGDLHVAFSWMKMVREKHGNPFNHAIVFVQAYGGEINGVYCVVVIPQDT